MTWSYFLLLQMSIAVALRTDWSPSRRRAGEQAVVAVHPRSDKSGDSRLRSPKGQRLDAAPDETELAKATADYSAITLLHFVASSLKFANICAAIARPPSRRISRRPQQ